MQTDSTASSERTEAESISTEDSCYGDSSVAWIKPQLQNQLPSRLRTQHKIPGSPDLCRISCCCGGPQSSTITTDIPCKDPRTYVTEDVYPVLMVSGRTYLPPSLNSEICLEISDGVWTSQSSPNPPEDPEWIRRRVVAVEQQQWNHYLAASAKAVQIGQFAVPTFTDGHDEHVPDVVHETEQEDKSSLEDSGALDCEDVSSPSSPSTAKSKYITSRERDDIEISGSAENFEKLSRTPNGLISTAVTHINLDKSESAPEKTVELQPPFVKWILVPQDFTSDLKPLAHLLPMLGPTSTGEDPDTASSKISHGNGLSEQNVCPNQTLQRWHF